MLRHVLTRLLRRPAASHADTTRVQRLQAALSASRQGDHAEAEAGYLALTADFPADAAAHHLLGNLYVRLKRYGEAVRVLEKAAAIDGDTAEIQLELAGAYTAYGEPMAAIGAYRAALAAAPHLAVAWNNLAKLEKDAGDLDAAELSLRRLVELEPRSANGHIELGYVLLLLGRAEEAVESLRRALEIDPDSPAANANFLYALHFDASRSAEQIAQAHRAWGERVADPISARSKAPERAARRARLRVGYASPDFRHHPVGYFIEPVLEHHDAERFEVFCYSDVEHADAYTARLAGRGTWRETFGLADDEWVERVRADDLDILVDLTGHTAGNRLLAFAQRPGRVQVTWGGYINTTGMRAIDYRISDAFADPPGADALYIERLTRLPEIYMPYRPPTAAAPALPHEREPGRITFGSFNALQKVNAGMIGAWARILRRVPEARLLICAVSSAATRQRLNAAFAAHGVDPERLTYRPRLAYDRFIETYEAVDVALDTFPFCGASTTYQTLWMGVPVVTLTGKTLYARASGSILANLGLNELITAGVDEYVERAVALALAPRDLAALSRSLRDRMAASSIMDEAGFTRKLEAAYSLMWNDYCKSPRP